MRSGGPMNPLRNIVRLLGGCLLPLLAVLAAGCGKSGGAATSFRDQNPLPADTMTVSVPEIGSYGGRFVIGQTTGPKTFNGMMANETSSTDITQRMFIGLADFDNMTQGDTPSLAKSW